jgi:Arc/MetJ family transcription regulator
MNPPRSAVPKAGVRSTRPRRPAVRTTLNLPEDLLRAAQRSLGTTGITATVVRAMEEAVRLKLRLRLLEHDMTELTPELVEELRRPRVPGGEPSPPAESTGRSHD